MHTCQLPPLPAAHRHASACPMRLAGAFARTSAVPHVSTPPTRPHLPYRCHHFFQDRCWLSSTRWGCSAIHLSHSWVCHDHGAHAWACGGLWHQLAAAGGDSLWLRPVATAGFVSRVGSSRHAWFPRPIRPAFSNPPVQPFTPVFTIHARLQSLSPHLLPQHAAPAITQAPSRPFPPSLALARPR